MRELKSKTCCFTGHRKILPNNKKYIYHRLKITLINLIENGYLYFGAGGAIGFDTLAAQCVLELKEYYPQIRLILVLPCVSQSKKWRKNDIDIYNDIKLRADKIVYVSYEYTKDCMYKRNRYLIDNSSMCVCYLTEKTGGTAYTVQYAKDKSVDVINLK